MSVYTQMRLRFSTLCETGQLFVSTVPGSELWQWYLEFVDNPEKFRDPDSNAYNCNTCHAFFKRFGNIVALDKDLNIITLFDFVPEDPKLKKSFDLLRTRLKQAAIANRFIMPIHSLLSLGYGNVGDLYHFGIASNVKCYTKEEAEKFGIVKPNQVITFEHFSVDCPKQFLSNSSASREALLGEVRSTFDVFKRGLDEIPLDTLELVRDLIQQGSLLNGSAHLTKVKDFIEVKRAYSNVPNEKKDNWIWAHMKSTKCPRFRNELIGVLCTELAEGKELNEACKAWNYRVDPANYMKATAPITQKQINEAMKFAQEQGYEPSFLRRMATLEDIKTADILHAQSESGEIKKVSVFDKLQPTVTTRHKRSEFKDLQEITIEKFLADVLPTCTSIEALFESRLSGNLVTMTCPVSANSKPIFKWDNNFSWTYNGGLAGKSEIKTAVKAAGGFVDAPFRFSILWNDEETKGIVDFDAHCKDASGFDINYAAKHSHKTGGDLDIDMIRPRNVGVENIYWTNRNTVPDGTYRFYIHNFDGGNNSGVKAELTIDGEVYTYWCKTKVTGSIDIATVTIKHGQVDSIIHSDYLVDSLTPDVWGLKSGEFHKVNLMCLSPNYWGTNTGNKHYFFMLEDCKNPDCIRGFHNENLIAPLLEHRKVMEVLGAKLMVEPSDKQLSGLGFNATVKDYLIVKLGGSHKRVVKIIF